MEPTEKSAGIDEFLKDLSGKDRKSVIQQRQCATCEDPDLNFRDPHVPLFGTALELYEALESIIGLWNVNETRSVAFSDAIERGANAIAKARGEQ